MNKQRNENILRNTYIQNNYKAYSIGNAVGTHQVRAKGIRTRFAGWVREMSMSYTEKGQKGL